MSGKQGCVHACVIARRFILFTAKIIALVLGWAPSLGFVSAAMFRGNARLDLGIVAPVGTWFCAAVVFLGDTCTITFLFGERIAAVAIVGRLANVSEVRTTLVGFTLWAAALGS